MTNVLMRREECRHRHTGRKLHDDGDRGRSDTSLTQRRPKIASITRRWDSKRGTSPGAVRESSALPTPSSWTSSLRNYTLLLFEEPPPPFVSLSYGSPWTLTHSLATVAHFPVVTVGRKHEKVRRSASTRDISKFKDWPLCPAYILPSL